MFSSQSSEKRNIYKKFFRNLLMAVQSPLPDIKTSTGQSPLRTLPIKAATMTGTKPPMPMTPVAPKQSTPMATGAGAPPPTSLSSTMSNQPAPKSRKWFWILVGLFVVLVVSAIGIGLYLWLT